MIDWKLKKWKLADLVPYGNNARTLDARQERHLKDSMAKFGLAEKPIVNKNGTIIGGHQRITMLKNQGTEEIECWTASKTLDNEELAELNIRLNRHNGDWDWDMLGNLYDPGELLTWGFNEDELGLEQPRKEPKKPKPVISLEFEDTDTMMRYVTVVEKIAEESAAKMKVKG